MRLYWTMYKDKDKQRDAVKLATRRYRARLKGITVSQGKAEVVIPDSDTLSAKYPSASRRSSNDTQSVIPKQSYNPMMVGYEPPEKL